MEIRKLKAKLEKMSGQNPPDGRAEDKNKFISPKELMVRWRCSRASVDRYCDAAGIRRLVLGDGKNGGVRYLMADILRFERERTV